jgi:LCP family protein required for cell wall assembly
VPVVFEWPAPDGAPDPPDLDGTGRPRRGKRRRARRSYWPIAFTGARVLAATLSIIVLVGSGYIWATFDRFESNVTHIDAIVPLATPTVTPSKGAARPVTDVDGTDQNILLVGDDSRPANMSKALEQELSTGDDEGSDDTDTMIVMHVPANGSRATLISFPRDSWVNIPGFGMNKLNAAFVLGEENGGGDAGGARLLIKVIQTITGLTIDHFVRVSLLGFYDIAKVLGPIRVCLNEAAHDSYSGTNLPAGVSHLNARQALSFVRQRHNLPDGDLDREIRQQYFLAQALSKVTTAGTLLNPFKLQSLLNAVSSSLEVDNGLQGSKLFDFAEQMQNLEGGNVTYATIPITGTPTIQYNGGSVSIVALDFPAIPGFISKVIGPSTAYTKAVAAAPTATTVTVINESNTDLVATKASTALNALGFHASVGTSTGQIPTTTIEYPAGLEAQAKAVARELPGAEVSETPAVATVTLLIGTDNRTVGSPAHTANPSSTSSGAAQGTGVARTFTSKDCIN